MENETGKHLWALREVNKAQIIGLETAVFVMEKWDELTPERRRSMIDKLKRLIYQSNEAYGTEPTKH